MYYIPPKNKFIAFINKSYINNPFKHNAFTKEKKKGITIVTLDEKIIIDDPI